jgi:antirestriction protein ArdC
MDKTLISEYRTAILSWLKKEGPKTPVEIEDFVRDNFHHRWQGRDLSINRNGMPQWRNDVHWARARLTREGKIVKGGGKISAVADDAVKPRTKKAKPTTAKEPTKDSKTLFDTLTADVLVALRAGNPPWRKLWGDLRRPQTLVDYAPLAIPTNAETGKPYFGVNTLLLWNAARKHGFSESCWGTGKTWWRLDAAVTSHAHSTRVLAWVKLKKSKEEDDENRPIWHCLYNLAQVEGCDHLRRRQSPVRSIRKIGDVDISRASDFIAKCGAKVEWKGDRAFYRPSQDLIRMPHKQRFATELDAMTILFHELGHWTGSTTRLNRSGVVNSWAKDSPEYAFEELVAELTACFLLSWLDIPDRYQACQHAGYIDGYIKLLEDDSKALRRAAGCASKATRYLSNLFAGKGE